MLQILRKKAQSTFIQVIVVIIALVFIFWGVGTQLRNSRQAAVVVNGEEITFQQFQKAYDDAYQRLSNQFGGRLPKGFAESFGLKQQVINQLVQEALLRQGAAEMGIKVSGQEVRNVIKDMVQFQENGAFSLDRYKTILAANRLSTSKFEQSIRFDRLSQVAAREIGRFGDTVTDFEIQDAYSRINEKVAVNYVKVTPEMFADKVAVDEKDLAAWFEAHKDDYKSDPQLQLKYLLYSYDDIARKITIDPAKIKEYYQNNIDAFKEPEQRHARHILFKVEEGDSPEVRAEKAKEAEKVLQLAKKGEDFAELAKKYSEGPSKTSGGDLGFFTRGKMVPEFEDKVFSMQPGEVSDVIQTPFGYHIIKLVEIKPAKTRSLEEATPEITRILQQKEAESLAFQMANQAYEGIIGAGSLAQYAETHKDAPVTETGYFTRSDAPAELKKDPQFLDKAFELHEGELSSLIKGSTGYAILFAEHIKQPEVPPLDQVRDRVTADYRRAKSEEMAEKAANELNAAIRSGKTIEQAAEAEGFTVHQSGLLGQNGAEGKSDFPAALVGNAFLLSPTSPVPEKPGKDGRDFYVYTFSDRQIPAMPTDNSEEMKKYRDALERYKQQQLISAWLRHMQANAKVTQNKSL